jgi:CheY-like chemotaxis protein
LRLNDANAGKRCARADRRIVDTKSQRSGRTGQYPRGQTDTIPVVTAREKKAMEYQSAAPIKILIVDDHGIVRDGLTALLDGQSAMTVVGTAGDGQEAVAAAERLKPDVVVMDLILPVMSGVDAIVRIMGARPQTRVVVLSACDSSEHVFQALRAGARLCIERRCQRGIGSCGCGGIRRATISQPPDHWGCG